MYSDEMPTSEIGSIEVILVDLPGYTKCGDWKCNNKNKQN